MGSSGILRVSAYAQGVFESLAPRLYVGVVDVARIAFALAIRSSDDISLSDDYDGSVIDREALFGEWDSLFKSLVISREGRFIDDLEYFPGVVKSYLEAGARMLENEKRYASGDFYVHLANLEKGI